MKEPTTVETLTYLDSMLAWLAGERVAAAVADDIPGAERIDERWKAVDEDRQLVIARAADRDLIEYEIARGRRRQYGPEESETAAIPELTARAIPGLARRPRR